MATTVLTRRTVLKSAALARTALGMPFVHGAHAAGKLSCGFWDHWVLGANEPLAKLCREWAEQEKVDLAVDFITSQGDKLALTATAEGQARSGHDILQMSDWYPGRPGGQSRTRRRSRDRADQGARQATARFRIYRQAEGPLDRGPDRPPDHGAGSVRSHRLLQPIRRAGRDPDVPGGAPPDQAL